MSSAKCLACGSEEGCLKYTITDRHKNKNKYFACEDCAEELGLETDEEQEKQHRKWLRNHLRMRMGREISDEEFEKVYQMRPPV